MSFINFKKMTKISKEWFPNLEPHEQYSYVTLHSNQPELLKELYPSAKDDITRLEIVNITKDSDLAERLFINTKYPLIKARLVPFIKNKELLRDFFVSYINSAEALRKVKTRLTDEQNRALIQSMKELHLLPDDVNTEFEDMKKRNPMID